MTGPELSEFLRERPLFVLFGVAAAGFLVGKVNVRGFSLGVAAVLFVGLLVGALLPDLVLPPLIAELGLVLFVYTLGLASGPGFFAALRLGGLRDNALALGVLVAAAVAAGFVARALAIDGAAGAGLYAGALTNTPALAAVVETLRRTDASPETLAAPVIAYSVCYPLGVLVPMLATWLAQRRAGTATAAVSEAYAVRGGEAIVNATVRIARPPGARAADLRQTPDWVVVFGRMRRGDATSIVHDDTVFATGDLVTVIGTEPDVAAAAAALGTVAETRIDLDRTVIDYRRMFVSNPKITGRPLADLRLVEHYEAVITRVRRGDVDLVPTREFRLQPGDRVRVLAARARMPQLEEVFGDSLRRIAEVDFITFSLGIILGLLLGAVPIPLPGGGTFALGMAGGPLVAGLVLGRLGRTGPLLWASPFAANLTLRQAGLVLFLAGIGLRSGEPFASSLASGSVLVVALGGALVTLVSATLTVVLGARLLGIPVAVLTGMLSGIHTQPAALAFAVEKAGNDLPNVGYTTVFPLATIAKIALAQSIAFALLR